MLKKTEMHFSEQAFFKKTNIHFFTQKNRGIAVIIVINFTHY